MDQAAILLEQDETTPSLFGSSLWNDSPFSRSSSLTSFNGKTSTSVQSSFDVYGGTGQGVAPVASTNGNLAFVDSEVDNRLYRLNADSSPSSISNSPASRDRNYNREPACGSVREESENHADAIEAGVLEGVRGGSPYRGNVLDAEILDKTFL